MDNVNKVFCLFEQSGTFKNVFRKMGIDAKDYDIKNEYGQTDVIIDLFKEIESAYSRKKSIFDEISCNDLIIAFFPCIYFAESNQMLFRGVSLQQKNMTPCEKIKSIIHRNQQRSYFYEILLQLFFIAEDRNLRLIVENPYNANHYLHLNFPYEPSVIDRDRYLRGDKFTKPTQYFFVNCQPTNLHTYSPPPCNRLKIRTLHGNTNGDGLCNKERSEITSEYAENFINDCIFGLVRNKTTQLTIW